MRSDQIKKGPERVPHRALLYATGISEKDMKKPFIGVATSFTDIIPGHIGMRELERFIERGICAGGGVPFFFGIPGICDGIAMGHSGMHYPLALRELVADSVESVVNAHQFDGLICLTNCDKITPGMLIAIARLNIPSIVVTAGPMLSGRYNKRKLAFVHDTFEAMARARKGDISNQELSCLELEACPGAGSCQGLYTANTMACLTETMGLSLPGCATALAVSAKKRRIAQASGERIVELLKDNILPKKIITKESLMNAVIVDMALGGSSNTVLHLKAIAYEAGIELPLKKFDEISKKTPNITSLEPAGVYFMEDLEYAGGIPAVLKRLKSKLNNTLTVSGKKINDIAKEAEIFDADVIRPFDKAYHKQGGIAVLFGNLAPNGAVVKQTAVSEKVMKFKGIAKCYNSEEEALKDILDKKIKKGTVIVIRYEGPKGGPGMREMLASTSAIVGMGLSEDVALITDGRFSGGTKGPCIGHISPEAAGGGPIAIIKDGDNILIDIPKRKLELSISKNTFKKRLKSFKPIAPKINTGYLARYAKMVTSADRGAVLVG
ncbi:MAG: dihydroxy-acid dehydratase [Candidatus Omnitrophica bacterium]|nr:dihydroxy-acid dehydratase [Candidatus Omnitrophota bacterium]